MWGLEAIPTAVYEAGFHLPWEKEHFSPLQEASPHSAWFSDTSGRSNVCFQLPGSEQILSKNKTLFYTDFLEDFFFCSRTSLGISYSVQLSLLVVVGSRGWKECGWGNRMENSVTKAEVYKENPEWLLGQPRALPGWPCSMRSDSNLRWVSHKQGLNPKNIL